MGKEKNWGGKGKSLFMFKVRNIVYRENLIHSVEKCLSEKVSNKDVQMCLNELESGFFWVVCPAYVAKIGDESNISYLVAIGGARVVTKA